jgi:hypothetical protein
MPTFLDFVFSFHQNSPLLRSGYRQEDTLLDFYDQRFLVRGLGRSGASIRHCFNLQAVSSQDDSEDGQWSIRQTAVYHNFDLVTGRAFWIISHNDDKLTNRVRAMALLNDSLLAEDHANTVTSFRATLTTHLLLMQWASESWRDYIQDLEQRIQIQEDKITNTFSLISALRVTDKKVFATDTTETAQTRLPKSHDGMPSPRQRRCEYGRMSNDLFSVQDLQRLHELEKRIESTILILSQNSIIVRSIADHYEKLMGNPEFPSQMKERACYEAAKFFEQGRMIEIELHSRQVELQASHLRLKSLREHMQALKVRHHEVVSFHFC